eukprot:CAMPEP_0113673250 /NCGR_PEP_ID=MMETSP0038_2-20120614/6750_1 /TAXON_ID=2898 /ORGANISM="Cryptomonas paramecium" /LENGTH=70 /DNA_ID=CAMNT_0000589681 /DNA_START=228 /DNA_END=440 /DNA_ORIENTATION=- /assembly_acc=CAM_ASM_000170
MGGRVKEEAWLWRAGADQPRGGGGGGGGGGRGGGVDASNVLVEGLDGKRRPVCAEKPVPPSEEVAVIVNE